MTEPVRLPSGKIENFIVKTEGKSFRCTCGCNVFHKPDKERPNRYECNACGILYEGE